MEKLACLVCISVILCACDFIPAKDKGTDAQNTSTIAQTSSSTDFDGSAQNECKTKESDKQLTPVESNCFVTGVSNYKLYKPSSDESNKGVTFCYNGRNLKVNLFDYQIGLYAQLIDEYGDKTDIGYNDILAVADSNYDYDEYYKDWEYVVTQYDIDSDGKDEIIIASRINDGLSTPVGIFIFRIKDGKTWSLKAPQTWGNMKVKLVNNHVKVEPNHYGFTYDWSFENDEFVDRGEY